MLFRSGGHHGLVLGGFRLGLEDGLRHVQDGLDLRHGECDPRQGGESAGNHAVGPVEGNILRGGDLGLHRDIEQDNGAGQTHGGGNGPVDLQKQRRIIAVFRGLGIGVRPAGEGAFLRAGDLDLLHPGDQRKADAVFLGAQLHDLFADAHLHEGADQADGEGRRGDEQRRHHQRRGIVEDLGNVEKAHQGTQACGKDAAQQERTELIDGIHTAGEFTGGVFSEEVCRQVHQAHHHGRLHRQGGLDLHAAHEQLARDIDQLAGQDGAEHEHRRAKQEHAVPAVQHEAGQKTVEIENKPKLECSLRSEA